MAEVDVRLDRVTKRFHDVVAVDDLSLDVRRGEFFSLLGPSGCGKTTTLRMIGGFEEATSGKIFLAGTDVTGLPPYRRNVNTVFQNYALFPHLSVYENVAFGLRRRRVASGEIRHQVGSMLELVELPGYEARRPSQLSGGQQQRVALARALINHPQVLLLDEPLGALDLKLRKQMQIELKRIQTEVGITFIYVTHDQEEAMTMSDRIAVMRGGHIEQLGAPEELYERPGTAFVAGFLGVSNLLDGDVAEVDGDYSSVRLTGGTLLRAPRPAVNGARRVQVGVRPEKLRVVPISDGSAAGSGDLNTIEGTILDASYIGVSTQYLVETRDGQRLTVYSQNLETSGAGEALADGQQVRLTWKPQHTFVIGQTDDPTAQGALNA
ncbi:MAG: spermidine/putrescine ABC transporter ATP-binding protein [Chloroflexi bacterium]|nr:MAG: spermidine/putrescine ABC transporter ATP-binding protein [Chloroflexota bacterium]